MAINPRNRKLSEGIKMLCIMANNNCSVCPVIWGDPDPIKLYDQAIESGDITNAAEIASKIAALPWRE